LFNIRFAPYIESKHLNINPALFEITLYFPLYILPITDLSEAIVLQPFSFICYLGTY